MILSVTEGHTDFVVSFVDLSLRVQQLHIVHPNDGVQEEWPDIQRRFCPLGRPSVVDAREPWLGSERTVEDASSCSGEICFSVNCESGESSA